MPSSFFSTPQGALGSFTQGVAETWDTLRRCDDVPPIFSRVPAKTGQGAKSPEALFSFHLTCQSSPAMSSVLQQALLLAKVTRHMYE